MCRSVSLTFDELPYLRAPSPSLIMSMPVGKEGRRTRRKHSMKDPSLITDKFYWLFPSLSSVRYFVCTCGEEGGCYDVGVGVGVGGNDVGDDGDDDGGEAVDDTDDTDSDTDPDWTVGYSSST